MAIFFSFVLLLICRGSLRVGYQALEVIIVGCEGCGCQSFCGDDTDVAGTEGLRLCNGVRMRCCVWRSDVRCEADVEAKSSSKGGCMVRSLNVNGLSREGLKAIFGGVVVGGWW